MGETRMCPGRRGLRFTRQKDRGVRWKTWGGALVLWPGWMEAERIGGMVVFTWEVTMWGPKWIILFMAGGMVAFSVWVDIKGWYTRYVDYVRKKSLGDSS